MLEKGELIGILAKSLFLNQPCTLCVSNKVEVLLKMPTEDEEETRDKWVDCQATIVKIEDDQYLIYSNIRPTDASTQWFPAMCVHKAPQAFSYSMPRHAGLPQDD